MPFLAKLSDSFFKLIGSTHIDATFCHFVGVNFESILPSIGTYDVFQKVSPKKIKKKTQAVKLCLILCFLVVKFIFVSTVLARRELGGNAKNKTLCKCKLVAGTGFEPVTFRL